jgi:leader peptidase (prepilin peptidase)/N-methyltransferase
MGCFLIALFITDLEQEVLPPVIVYPGIAAALAFAALQPVTGTTPGIISALAGFAAGFAIFFLIWAIPRIFKKEMVGFGAAGMAGLIGASVGYPVALIALCIAVLAGGLAAIVLMALRIRILNQFRQFGMFLALAGMLSLFYGPDIADALQQSHIL